MKGYIFNLKNKFGMKHLYFLIAVIFIFNLIVGIWPVTHGEIGLNTDRARDMIFISQIADGKMTLIGPRASAIDNFYHGPIWWYMNALIAKIGGGEPIAIGFFWLFISLGFLIFNWIVWKPIIGKKKTFLLITLLTIATNFSWSRLYNPDIAGYLLPLIIWSMYKYDFQKRFHYIFLAYLFCGLTIQFQIAVGGPMLVFLVMWNIYQLKQRAPISHLISILLIPLTLFTYIAYDIRHDWQLSKALITHFTNPKLVIIPSWVSTFNQRLRVVLLDAFRPANELLEYNLLFTILTSLGIYELFSKAKQSTTIKKLTLLCIYFLVTYFLVSLFHRGWILTHYFSPLVSIYMLLVVLVIPTEKKIWVGALTTIIFVISIVNFSFFSLYWENHCQNIDSWCFQKYMSDQILTIPEEEVGIFIFSPDLLGYQQKWATLYAKSKNTQKLFINEKRKITYVISSPVPKDRPDLDFTYWVKNNLYIPNKYTNQIQIGGGYLLHRYVLDEKSLNTVPSETPQNWLHYR